MKQKNASRFLPKSITPVFTSATFLFIVPSLNAATATKTNTAGSTELTVGTAWTGGTGAGGTVSSADVATWNATSLTGAQTVSSPVTWNSMNTTGIGSPLSLSGSPITFSLNAGNDVINTTIQAVDISNDIILSSDAPAAVAIGSTTNRVRINVRSGGISTFGNITANGGAPGVENDANVMLRSEDHNGTTIVNGTLTIDGQLYKGFAHTAVLNGANSIGWVYTNSGTLLAGNDQAFGTGTIYADDTGGAFELTIASKDATPRNLGNTLDTSMVAAGTTVKLGQVAVGTGALTFGALNLGTANTKLETNANTSFSSVTGTTGGFIKSGTGTLTLTGASDYTGATIINAGTLKFTGSGTLGSGDLTVTGTLDLAATSQGVGKLGGSGSIQNSVASSTSTLTVGNNNASGGTFSGAISDGVGTATLTKTGSGTQILTGANTYTGATTVNGGILQLEGTGAINGSSGITINGSDAQLVFKSSTALTPAITLTQGTLDATGTIGAVNVGASDTNYLANGYISPAMLTTGNLSFAGAATLDLTSTDAGPAIAAGTLTTSGTDNAISINITRTGAWSNGPNNLISFTSFPGADINDFNFNVNNPTLGARQSIAGLVLNGNNIALQIDGTSIYWSGLQSNQWTLNPVGGLQNWKLTSDNTAADFWGFDDVVFNDAPGSHQTIQIDDANVVPNTTTFNNSAVNYTIASSGSYGISGGSVSKSGTGSVTLNTANTYDGGTTLNSGTLNVNTATALGTGALVINGGTLDNTSGGPITLTNNNTQTWNGDFTFTGTNALDIGNGAVTGGGSGDRAVTVSANSLTVGELKTAATQGFTKQGAGTLVISSDGANTAGSVVNGVLNVAGGTLQINRDSGVTGDFLAAGITGSGNITNGAASERRAFSTAATGSYNFSGTLANGGSGALGFTKSGGSTQTLSGNNNYTGQTTVNGGTLNITGTNASGGAARVDGSATTPAILNLQNSNALGTSVVTATDRDSGIQLQGGITLPATTTFVISNDGGAGGAATVPYAISNVSGDNTINGTISMTSGGGTPIIQSDSGSLTLAGNINIVVGAGGSRTLILQGASTGANTVSGVLSNYDATWLAGITKNGAGTWTVSGANTYTGPTIVNTGTLVISGNNAAATGAVSVEANATLGGNGNLGGSVTIKPTATHSLAVAAAPGAQTTRTITGSLTQTGSVLNLTAGGTPAPGVYVLATANGGIIGTPATINYNGISGSVAVNGNNLELTVFGAGGYGSWAATNANGQASNLDFDNDGVTNGIEYFMGTIGSSFTTNPGIVNGKVTWPKDPAFNGTYSVQTSPDLVTWTNVSSTVVGNTVEYTVPTGQGKLFIRLDVKPN